MNLNLIYYTSIIFLCIKLSYYTFNNKMPKIFKIYRKWEGLGKMHLILKFLFIKK